MKAYRYLFFATYNLWLKKKSENSIAHINTIITLTLSIFTNIISIPLVYLAIFKEELLAVSDVPFSKNSSIAIILIIIGVVQYLLFGRQKKLLIIMKEFENCNYRKAISISIIYLVVTFGLVFYVFLFTTPP
jgi:ABC-type sulfate transport system permease component